MAFNATSVFEVRTTGNNNNGGAFDPGVSAPGTDFSKQDAAQIAYTDLVVGNPTTTQLTSAAHPFDSTSPGNFINVTGGITVQTLEILSVAGNIATVDKAAGTAGATGGIGNLGGGLADPGVAAGLMVGGNTMFIKAGTYTISSVSSNVAGGRLAPPAGSTANPTMIIGYNTNRNVGNTDTKPLLQASTVSALTLLTVPANGNFYIDNVAFDGANLGTSLGIDSTASASGTLIIHCKGTNFTSAFQKGGGATLCVLCEATSNSGTSFQGSHYWGCNAHDNTNTGFSNLGDSSTYISCLSTNNSGASSDGFIMSAGMVGCINCTSYNNGRDGFRITAGAEAFTLVGCIGEANAGWQYRGSAACGNVRLIQCGGKADGLGLVDTTSITGNQIGTITATTEIFINVTGNDFRLNNDPNGGGKFKAAGLPGSSALLQIPGFANSLGFVDCGAFQHQDAIPPLVGFQAGMLIAGS